MLFNKKFAAILLLTWLAIGSSVTAQNALVKTGNHHYESLSFIKAIDAYESALAKGKLNADEVAVVKIRLGESYCKIKDTQNAERILREVIESGIDLSGENAVVCLKFAQVLASNGKYREAQEMYEEYNNKVGDDPRGKSFSKLYNDVSVLSKNANCYKVDYLSVNTNAAEFSPSYYQNGLVFVSNRSSSVGVRRVFKWNETPFLDLFHLEDISLLGSGGAGLGGASDGSTLSSRSRGTAHVGSEQYTPISANDSRTIGSYGGTKVNLGLGYGDKPQTPADRFSGSLNSKYHEGPTAFFKDGSKVVFTRNNFLNGKTRRSSDGINKLKLYLADADGDGWKNIQELPFNSDEYSTGHPTLSANEDLLIFASDMPGGFGGTDVYVSRYDGANWSAPINLGDRINTKGNEMFPYMDEKDNLYFSSDGHPGLGELDVFYTQLEGLTQKGRIINIGAPINSSKDDFGIVTDGVRQTGYFSSNRKRGGADDDIYRFDRECELKEGCELILAVYDADSKMPLANIKIVFEDSEGNLQEAITDEDGALVIEDLNPDDEYTFRATREGYEPNTVSFSTEGCDSESSRLEIPMSILKSVKPVGASNSTNQTTNGSGTSGNNGSSTGTYLNEGQCILAGRVLSQTGNASMEGVLVTLKSECDGSTQTAYTDATGYYQFAVTERCDYTIEGTSTGLGSKGKRIRNVSCAQGNINADIYMFGQGDIVQIDNIYFDYGKCILRSDARVELDKLVTMMRQYPNMRIELRAHTDSRSTADFNQKISEGRAKVSANYLFKRGVSRSRVEFRGYGETMPVNSCVDGVKCSEDQHAANRRTEILILQME
jgi:outer membrane protein OmpA-like peptidoglycan-associated protein/tetratricopeptide (TPR) repeat protein